MCPTNAAATGATPPPVPTTEGEVPSEFTPVSATNNAASNPPAVQKNPYGVKYADFLSNVS